MQVLFLFLPMKTCLGPAHTHIGFQLSHSFFDAGKIVALAKPVAFPIMHKQVLQDGLLQALDWKYMHTVICGPGFRLGTLSCIYLASSSLCSCLVFNWMVHGVGHLALLSKTTCICVVPRKVNWGKGSFHKNTK